MSRAQVTDWVAAYERAWRTPGTGGLGGIFTEDAVYRQGPYDLWVIRFAGDGRCASFEEWPFWPAQPFAADRSGMATNP